MKDKNYDLIYSCQGSIGWSSNTNARVLRDQISKLKTLLRLLLHSAVVHRGLRLRMQITMGLKVWNVSMSMRRNERRTTRKSKLSENRAMA